MFEEQANAASLDRGKGEVVFSVVRPPFTVRITMKRASEEAGARPKFVYGTRQLLSHPDLLGGWWGMG